jgi:hypothetical protein
MSCSYRRTVSADPSAHRWRALIILKADPLGTISTLQ